MTPGQTSVTHRLRLSADAKLRRRIMVTDEPVKANVRIGLLLEVLDKLAEETALRYVRKFYPEARVVTAAMDDLRVSGAPDVEQDIILRARVNWVGKTSLEVGIRVDQPGNPARHVGSCFFTMVARMRKDGQEVSVPLPQLTLDNPLDLRRARDAAERREARRKAAAQVEPTPEEYRLLRALHQKQDGGDKNLILARDLVVSGWERTYPEQENVPQTIFGGYVAHRAYIYANICAELIADQRALLVASDRIDFYHPVRMGDKLHFESRITYTGKTSLAVETTITRISRDRTETALSNTCVFTFVNVDADLKALPVPQIYPTNYAEDERYLAGHRRHSKRLAGAARRAIQPHLHQ